MVNWQDPEIQLFCAHVSIFVAVICVGCYFWEFLVSLRFDWELITRKRPWRWTVLPYMCGRYAALSGLILGSRAANVLQPSDSCSALWQAIYACSDTAMACESMLLILRVIAISGNNVWVRVFLGTYWTVLVAFLFKETIQVRGAYVPELLACGTVNSLQGRISDFISLPLYLCCLGIVFLSLLPGAGNNLVKLLISQGVVYFVAVLVAFVPAVILYALDLNESMNGMMQPVTLIVMVICMTRMYRGLVQFDDPRTPHADSFVMTSTGMGWGRSAHVVVPAGFVASGAEGSDDTQNGTGRRSSKTMVTFGPSTDNVEGAV